MDARETGIAIATIQSLSQHNQALCQQVQDLTAQLKAARAEKKHLWQALEGIIHVAETTEDACEAANVMLYIAQHPMDDTDD